MNIIRLYALIREIFKDHNRLKRILDEIKKRNIK